MNKLAYLEGYLYKQALKLDLDIGDVVLGGRYKNKREVVETLGTDELGQPTVNGKKLLSFRIEKKLPRNKWSSKTKELEKTASLFSELVKGRKYIPPVQGRKMMESSANLVTGTRKAINRAGAGNTDANLFTILQDYIKGKPPLGYPPLPVAAKAKAPVLVLE